MDLNLIGLFLREEIRTQTKERPREVTEERELRRLVASRAVRQ